MRYENEVLVGEQVLCGIGLTYNIFMYVPIFLNCYHIITIDYCRLNTQGNKQHETFSDWMLQKLVKYFFPFNESRNVGSIIRMNGQQARKHFE